MSSNESDTEENSESEEETEKKLEDTKNKTKPSQNLSNRDLKQTALERCLPRINCEEHIVSFF